MDRSQAVLLTRAAGAAALAALLAYAGVALERAQPPALELFAYGVVAVLVAWAGVWTLARVAARKDALALALILLGLAPVATFLGWWLLATPTGVLAAVLWWNLIAGLVTAGLVVRLLAAASAAEERPSVARVE